MIYIRNLTIQESYISLNLTTIYYFRKGKMGGKAEHDKTGTLQMNTRALLI